MCETCNSFREFYTEYGKPLVFNPPISLERSTINEEIAAQKLLDNTPDKIEQRGKYSITRTSNVVKEVNGKNKTLEKMEWKNTSKEYSEKRPHAGYIIYDPSTKDFLVYSVFCDCCNFNFYWYAPLVRADLATFDLEPKYRRRDQLRFQATGVGKHNKQWTKKTNPKGELAVCKHLYHMLDSFVIGNIHEPIGKNKIPLSKDKKLKEPEKKEVTPKVAPKKVEPVKKVEPKMIPKVEPKDVKGKEPIVKPEPEVKGK